MTAIRSISTPYLIISVILTRPDAYTMAFGGVETGSASATDAERAAATEGIIGFTPDAIAMEITMGIAMFVAAVFDIVSDKMTVKRAAANVSVAT